MSRASSPQRDLLVAVLEAERATRKLTTVVPLENRLKRQLIKAWKVQGTAVRAALARHSGDFPELREAVDPAELATSVDHAVITSPALVSAVQVVADHALQAGGQSAELDLSIEATFTLHHPDAVSWLTQHGAERVANIDDVTRRYLRTILTEAADEGWSYAKTAKAIKDRFIQFAVGVPQEHIRSRAELVAVTEVGEAYEQGASIVARGVVAQGIVVEKSWLDVGDERECTVCQGNAASSWILEGDSYNSGVDQPPAHPACRCTNQRRVKETI